MIGDLVGKVRLDDKWYPMYSLTNAPVSIAQFFKCYAELEDRCEILETAWNAMDLLIASLSLKANLAES